MGLSAVSLIVAGAVGLVAGALIGMIGVGGVVLVPVLIELPDLDVLTAVTSSMASYIAAGGVGWWRYSRHGLVPSDAKAFAAGSVPGALLGSLALRLLPGIAVQLATYTLMLMSAAFALYNLVREPGCCARSSAGDAAPAGGPAGPAGGAGDVEGSSVSKDGGGEDEGGKDGDGKDVGVEDGGGKDGRGEDSGGKELGADGDIEQLEVSIDGARLEADAETPGEGEAEAPGPRSAATLQVTASVAVAVGFFVGIGSAITGTSGPVILLPILFLLRAPTLPSLGVAQTIQVPIALAATAGNLAWNQDGMDVPLILVLACTLSVAVVAGAALARRVNQAALKRVVTVALLVAAVVLLVRLAAASAA